MRPWSGRKGVRRHPGQPRVADEYFEGYFPCDLSSPVPSVFVEAEDKVNVHRQWSNLGQGEVGMGWEWGSGGVRRGVGQGGRVGTGRVSPTQPLAHQVSTRPLDDLCGWVWGLNGSRITYLT